MNQWMFEYCEYADFYIINLNKRRVKKSWSYNWFKKKKPKRDKVFVEHQYRQNVFDLFTLGSHSCCGEYGHIYKPDRPISATDLQIKQVGQLEKKPP